MWCNEISPFETLTSKKKKKWSTTVNFYTPDITVHVESNTNNSKNGSLALKPSNHVWLNDVSTEQKMTPKTLSSIIMVILTKFKLRIITKCNKSNSFSLLYVNPYSLNKTLDEIEYQLKSTTLFI